jgi:hypothetical protein
VNDAFVYGARLFPVRLEIAEARHHLALGVGARESARHEILGAPFDVKAKLRVYVVVDSLGRDEEAEGAPDPWPARGASTRALASSPAAHAHRALPGSAVITSSTALV